MRRDIRRIAMFFAVVFIQKPPAIGTYQESPVFRSHVPSEQVSDMGGCVQARGERFGALSTLDSARSNKQLGGRRVSRAPAPAGLVLAPAAVRNSRVHAEPARAQIWYRPKIAAALGTLRIRSVQSREGNSAAFATLVQPLRRRVFGGLVKRVIYGGYCIDVGFGKSPVQLFGAGGVLRERDSQVARYLRVEVLGFVAVVILVF